MQFSKTSPLKSGESSEKSSGENRVTSCHVCGCRGFVGPDKMPLRIVILNTQIGPEESPTTKARFAPSRGCRGSLDHLTAHNQTTLPHPNENENNDQTPPYSYLVSVLLNAQKKPTEKPEN